MDGGLGFLYDTHIEDPVPDLSDSEVRALATNIVNPVWPASGVTHGQIVEVQVSVNEKGELTGGGYSRVPPALLAPVSAAIRQWKFNPLMRDGKPRYFHGTVQFVVP